jgi:hypothetical protein
MKTSFHALMLFAALVLPAKAEKDQPSHPGVESYSPTKIEWLAVVCQADLRSEISEESMFQLSITYSGPETIVIYVRYLPAVRREIMNRYIATARNVIKTTAKGYGWESWVKIEENIQMIDSPREQDPARSK